MSDWLFEDRSEAEPLSAWSFVFVATLIAAVVVGVTVGKDPGTLVLLGLAIFGITVSFASMLARGLKVANFSTLAISIFLICSRLTQLENGAAAFFGATALFATETMLLLTYRWAHGQPVKKTLVLVFVAIFAASSGLAVFTAR